MSDATRQLAVRLALPAEQNCSSNEALQEQVRFKQTTEQSSSARFTARLLNSISGEGIVQL